MAPFEANLTANDYLTKESTMQSQVPSHIVMARDVRALGFDPERLMLLPGSDCKGR